MGFAPPRPPRKPAQMTEEERTTVTIVAKMETYVKAVQAGIISINEFREALEREGLQVGIPVPRMQPVIAPLSDELMRVEETVGAQEEINALTEQLQQKHKELQEALKERMVEPDKPTNHRRLELE